MNAKKAAAMIAIKADSGSLDRDLAGARKKLRGFGADLKKIGGKLWGGGKGALSSIGAGLGVQAATGITETISSVMDFERSLTRFQVAAGKTDAEMTAMRDSILGVSKATGVSTDSILAGTQKYVDLTGDVAGATAAMSSFARIAQASGADVADVADATAALRGSMKLDPSQIEAAFSGLITQGKKGAVSLKDLAGELSELAPQFAGFGGGSGLTGIREMGAAFQTIRTGAGSASGAATQFKAMMSELVASHKELGAIGIKVFEKDGKSLRNLMSIMDDLAKSKALDNEATLGKVFQRQEAQQAVRTIRQQIAATHDLAAAGMNTTAVNTDLATVLASNAGRMDLAMNNLKLAIAEAFTPERIRVFVETVEKVASAIGTVIEGLGDLKDYLTGDDLILANQFLTDPYEVMEEKAASGDPEAVRQLANAKAFDKSLDGIQSAGGREEKIKAAVMASRNYSDGTFGSRTAGDRFLAYENVSPEKVEQIAKQQRDTGAAQTSAVLQLLKQMIDRPVVVKLDASAVAKTVDNAPAANRGGR